MCFCNLRKLQKFVWEISTEGCFETHERRRGGARIENICRRRPLGVAAASGLDRSATAVQLANYADSDQVREGGREGDHAKPEHTCNKQWTSNYGGHECGFLHVHVLTDGAAVDVSASHGRLALHRWRHGRCDNCNSALGGGECNDQCSLRRRRQGMCTTRAQCMFCIYKRTIDFFNLDFSDSPNDVEQRKCPAPRTKEARYFSSYPKIKAVNHIGHS